MPRRGRPRIGSRRTPLLLETVPDGDPRRGFFTEPVRVVAITPRAPERHEAGWRVTFQIEVRDAEGRRCPRLAVDARLSGPERVRAVQAVTDLMGQVTMRMAGPAGRYDLEILEVAARGLRWDRDAGPVTASLETPG